METLKKDMNMLTAFKKSRETQRINYPLQIEDTKIRQKDVLVLQDKLLQSPILFSDLIGLGLGVKYNGKKKFIFAMRAIYSFTVVPATDVFTSAHHVSNGDILALVSTGTLPTGVDSITLYTVTNATATTFKLSGVNVTTTGSGTHYFAPQS